MSDGQTSRYRDLSIHLSVDGEMAVGKVLVPGGEDHSFKFTMPSTPAETARALSTARESVNKGQPRGISSSYDSPDPLRDLGTRLFSSVFGNIYEQYRSTLQAAAGHAQTLRIQVVTKDEALSALPWEFLYDVFQADFAALHAGTTVIRKWDEGSIDGVLEPIESPLRVLIVALGKSGVVDEELSIVRKAGEEHTGSLKLDVVRWPGEGQEHIAEQVSAGDFHLLHLMADADSLYPDELSSAMERRLSTESPLRVVYSSGVDTRWLARLKGEPEITNPSFVSLGDIAGSVSLPISTHTLMGRSARLTFTRSFYKAICTGNPLDVAVSMGRHTIDREMPGSREWGIPVLYLQAGDEPLLATGTPAHAGLESFAVSESSMSAMDELRSRIAQER